MTDFKAKMHQIRFRLGLRSRPRWGSLQRSPEPLAGFGGRFAAGGGAGLGKRREGEVEGREREGPQVTVEPGPLRALLRHCVHRRTVANALRNARRYTRDFGTKLRRNRQKQMS